MQVKGWDLIAAARYLADRAGIPWPEDSEEMKQAYEKQQTQQAAMAELVKQWSQSLRTEDLDYFKGRGFTEEFIKAQGWGYCTVEKPADKEAARELGLLITTKKGRDWHIPGERLVIPFEHYGRLAQLAFHKPGEKYLYPAGWSKPLISNISPVRHFGPAYLVEGVFCYLSLLQTELPAVTALGSKASREQIQELAKFKDLVVLFDGDKAGQEAALVIAKKLFPAARVYDLPEGKDLNDILKERGQAEFKEFVLQAGKEAKNYLALVLERLEQDPGDEKAREEAIKFIARIENSIERELKINKLAELMKPLKIGKTVIRTEIDKLRKQAEQAGEAKEEEEKQADILIKIATNGAYLFHDETRDGFANLEVNNHRETWPLTSKFYKQWLVRQYYEKAEKSPGSEAVRQALGVIEAKAVFDGPEHKLSLRVAEKDGAIYYDLANDTWQMVKITTEGWEVVENTKEPIFRRFKNTAAQVKPERGGTLELLQKYINFKKDSDWLLANAFIVAALAPQIPHTIPIKHGDKGGAKTTAQRIFRKLIDPAHRDTMTLPTDKNELALMLMTNYAPCFDNLDGLQPWQSDMLCCAATGGGISKRELYTDMDEVILSFLRCPMLNGINLVASRDDLIDRSLIFQLERIDEEHRKEEKEFWKEFERDRPLILGAIFDTLSKAMKIHSTVKLDR
ncbi:MAG: toprim domain-containing protein, partial [Candidatus Contubernalis sp.]|nr:toprim domain-containing protein [Candidatus Contubernalis sp.]